MSLSQSSAATVSAQTNDILFQIISLNWKNGLFQKLYVSNIFLSLIIIILRVEHHVQLISSCCFINSDWLSYNQTFEVITCYQRDDTNEELKRRKLISLQIVYLSSELTSQNVLNL